MLEERTFYKDKIVVFVYGVVMTKAVDEKRVYRVTSARVCWCKYYYLLQYEYDIVRIIFQTGCDNYHHRNMRNEWDKIFPSGDFLLCWINTNLIRIYQI